MALLVDGLLGIAALSGVVLCLLGVYCYRRWDEPGVTPFAAVAVFLGVGSIVSTAVVVEQGVAPPENGIALWTDVALTAWVITMVPWVVFALEYTGRYTRFRSWTVLALSVPVLGIVSLRVIESVWSAGAVLQILGTISVLYVFALAIVGSYLLLRASYEYGHLSLRLGVSLSVAGIAPLIAMNSIGPVAEEAGDAVVSGVFVLASLTPAVALALAVFRYGMFESTPAAGTLGERAIPRETDDLVIVVDRDGRVIQLNETATGTLGVSPTDPLGEPFDALVGMTVEELRRADTIELETTVGSRKFDPQVTGFTDQHDRPLGTLLSLRDVTERELRKQRLEVFNRVLRHNLRNRVDVIKSNAETIAADSDGRFAEPILASADELEALGSKARSIDRLLSRPTQESAGDLSATLRDLIDDADVDVTFDGPESVRLVTDWEAVRAALDSAIENAIEYADESVTVTVEDRPDGSSVTVEDDGPGIPESELASIDDGSETPLQHGTGLGLWQLKWSVTKINGDLSFDTDGGTTVQVTIPSLTE